MSVVIFIWLMCGVAWWVRGASQKSEIGLGDFLVALPLCLLIGPIMILAKKLQ